MNAFLAPEHWHPLVVHFPLGLCLIGTIFYALSGLRILAWLESASLAMGFVGTGLGFLAQYTGQKAAEVVGPKLCRPGLLADHAQEMESSLIFFSVAWALAILFYVMKTRYLPRIAGFWWLKAMLLLGLLLGSIFMVSGGHKGFKLVYFQGAAVHPPLTLCVPSQVSSEK